MTLNSRPTMRLKSCTSGLLILILLTGCQNPPPAKATLQQMEKEMVSAPVPVPVPAEVRLALVPKLALDAHATPQIADMA